MPIAEIVAAALAIPGVKEELERLFQIALAEFLHRRASDPAFLAKSDAIFAQRQAAQTQGDRDAASKALADLMGS